MGGIASEQANVSFSEVPRLVPEDSLRFSACSEALRPETAAGLQDLAVELRASPFVKVSVEGHADSAPMWLGNKQLAQGRAMKVARHLENMGVAPRQLEVDIYADEVL